MKPGIDERVSEASIPTQISTSTQIQAGGHGSLLGIFVSAASSTPTIKVWNSPSATGTVLIDTFTPIAGTFYPMPFQYDNGLYVTIGGTVSCTVGTQSLK